MHKVEEIFRSDSGRRDVHFSLKKGCMRDKLYQHISRCPTMMTPRAVRVWNGVNLPISEIVPFISSPSKKACAYLPQIPTAKKKRI